MRFSLTLLDFDAGFLLLSPLQNRTDESIGLTMNGANELPEIHSKKAKLDTNGIHQTNGQTNGFHIEPTHGHDDDYYTKNERFTQLTFLEQMVDLIKQEAITEATKRESPVVEFKHPHELDAILRENMEISREGVDDETLLKASKDFIKYSVKTVHPRFYNQLGVGGWDQYSLSGCFLTEALNPSLYTFEVAPVFTLMEKYMISKMLSFAGFLQGEGTFTPGGSIANMYAMNIARQKMFPEIKTIGMCALEKPICILTSEQCHYSFTKAAGFLGIGSDCVIFVKTDSRGKMIPSELEKEINTCKTKGFQPYFVNATAGTTVLGAYDPLEDIADICEKYGLWMHVDGAWGGSALLSKNHRHLLKGIERADSMIWNPHKMMGIQQQCSTILCKHKDLLQESHSAKAKYLFQQDKFYDTSFDTGDKVIQCGRKVDCLKLWMAWKARGDAGYEEAINGLFDNAKYLAHKIKTTDGFRLLIEPECLNVCFWYIPASLRNQEESSEWWQKVGKVAPVIKQRMVERGSMLTGYQPEGDHVNFFRMIISNYDITHQDMDFVVEEIERLSHDL